MSNDPEISENPGMSWKKILLLCLAILAVAAVVTWIIFQTEPTAQREGATRETAMLVEVVEAERGNFTPVIVAAGTVQPEQEIILGPRVSGEVTWLSPQFVPGGYVRKGATLLQIDPSDYQNALALRKSALEQSLADLELEQGRQNVARQDFQLLDDSLPDENRSLVLREPQLRSIQAQVDAARAAVNQAELDLQRTTIRAPFHAHILSRDVNVGSQVTPGDMLARLVGMDAYWVEVAVPLSKLRWIDVPQDDREKGAEVRVRNRTAWLEGEYRRGYISELIGALEDPTRMARLLVTIPDPLAMEAGEDRPRLIIGSYVEAEIQGREIENVVRLKRDYLRKDQTVWVMEDGKLQIRDVDIEFQDEIYAYISAGLQGGEKVVSTNLATVAEGSPLRLEKQAAPSTSDSLIQNEEN